MRAFGWHTFDPELLWPSCRLRRQLYEPERALRELGLPAGEFGAAVQAEVADTDPYRFTEYLYELQEPASVEPLHGMVVLRGRALATSLLGVHAAVDVPPPYRLQYRRMRAQPVRAPRAVLLRHHYSETNYFHFFNDVLPILRLLEDFPEYQQWPLLVGRAQFETPFFRGMVERLGWQNRPWLIQDGTVIEVERLVVAKGLGLTRSWIDFLWRLLEVPPADAAAQRRIYLKRGPGTRRGLANQAEVEAICRRWEFETIDPGTLSFGEQIALFSQARHVVAEHGAGCTNILFRREQPLSLLELMPRDHLSTCYFLICHLLGQEHRVLRGASSARGGDGFSVDLSALEGELQAMVGR